MRQGIQHVFDLILMRTEYTRKRTQLKRENAGAQLLQVGIRFSQFVFPLFSIAYAYCRCLPTTAAIEK